MWLCTLDPTIGREIQKTRPLRHRLAG
ncbi:hypothetical protein [Sphingomonas adhaesiva]